jgi:putative DNA primase/helicase
MKLKPKKAARTAAGGFKTTEMDNVYMNKNTTFPQEYQPNETKIEFINDAPKFEFFPDEFRPELEEKWNQIKEKEDRLLNKIQESGYEFQRLEDFSKKLITSKSQSEISTEVRLKDEVAKFLREKNEFLKISNGILLKEGYLPKAIDGAENVFSDHNRGIFQKDGRLVKIIAVRQKPKKSKKIDRPDELHVISSVDTHFLKEKLELHASWVKYDGRKKDFKLVNCSPEIPNHLISREEWENVPVLSGILHAPTLREDGSILNSKGFDEETGLFLVPCKDNFPEIPENPSKDDAIRSLKQIRFIIKDFPFVESCNESVAVSAILTALIRKSIATAPLFGFSAPKMGSGKTLLAHIISKIATGQTSTVVPPAKNEAEQQKRLLPILMSGDPVCCFDNIEEPFGSSALCCILTGEKYEDRILGESKNIVVPTGATTFLATGNNLTFAGDLSTRALLCNLDAGTENPEERGFDFDPIKYISKHRGELVCAGLTILKAYREAGNPKQGIKPYGRFEEWSDWVRSALVWCGMDDPCESRKGIEDNDPIRKCLKHLYEAWFSVFGNEPKKIKNVVEFAINQGHESLKDALVEIAPDGKGGVSTRSLGKKLSKYKNRIEGKHKVEKMEPYQGIDTWRVTKC